MQARSSDASVIASRVHGERKRFRATECAGEKRYGERGEHADAPFRAAGKRCAAAYLGMVDADELVSELRHEAQGYAHDHAELVGGKAYLRERGEQAFKPFG